jgi:hypothetical protein
MVQLFLVRVIYPPIHFEDPLQTEGVVGTSSPWPQPEFTRRGALIAGGLSSWTATIASPTLWWPQGWSTIPLVPGGPNPAEDIWSALKSLAQISFSQVVSVTFSSIAPAMA